MSLLGFVFWVFVSHLYSASQIGVASALIAITTLISNLSLLGLNSSLMRFLPKSKDQSRDINAALLSIVGVTMLAAAVYLFVGGRFGANVSFLSSAWEKIVFIILMTTVTANSLTDAVFIANRRAEYHTRTYATLGTVKLLLPLVLVPLGSLGIFMAYIVAVIASLILSFYYMWRHLDYRMTARPNWNLLRKTRKYTTNNYIGVVLAGLPSQILPITILHRLGSAQAAYFSMAWMMANLLYVIPSATTQSMLAESSFDPSKKLQHIRHTSKILAFVLIPIVILAVVIAPFILKVFGQQYSVGSTECFQILAVATLFIAATSVGNTILNIEQRTHGIVIVQFMVASSTLLLALPLLHLGLKGVAIALLGGNIVGTITQFILLLRNRTTDRFRAATLTNGGRPNSTIVRQFLTARGLEQAQFGKDLGGGDRSATVIVTLGQQKFVLKIYDQRKRSFNDIKEELRFTLFLKKSGISVPRIMPAPNGRAITTIVSEDGATWHGVLMSYEEGSHPQDYPRTLLSNMAQTQAHIHNAGVEYSRLHRKKSGIIRHQFNRTRFLPHVTRGVSHFDYSGDNILVTDNTVSSVLDFEGMRYDTLFVCVYFTLACIYLTDADISKIATYLREYQSVRKLNIIERALIKIALFARYRNVKLLYAA
jgi:O-antigen/teichoic acid export membrane protein/Ser/Thr protein kinase RdoA (MazF antagonist)